MSKQVTAELKTEESSAVKDLIIEQIEGSIPADQPLNIQIGPYSFTFPTIAPNLQEEITTVIYRSLVESFFAKNNTDIVIVTSDLMEIPAHKLVLSAVSPFLRVIIGDNPGQTHFSIPYPFETVYPIIKSFYGEEFDINKVPADELMTTIRFCVWLQIVPYIKQIQERYSDIQLDITNFSDYILYLEQFKEKEVWSESMLNLIPFLLKNANDSALLTNALSPAVIAHFDSAILLDYLLTKAGFKDEQILPLIDKAPLTIREILHVFDSPHFVGHPYVKSFLTQLVNTGQIITSAKNAEKEDVLFSAGEYYYLNAIKHYYYQQSQYQGTILNKSGNETIAELTTIITDVSQIRSKFQIEPFQISSEAPFLRYKEPIPDLALFKFLKVKTDGTVEGYGCFAIMHKDSIWNPEQPKLVAFSSFDLKVRSDHNAQLFINNLDYEPYSHLSADTDEIKRIRRQLTTTCPFKQEDLIYSNTVVDGEFRANAPDANPRTGSRYFQPAQTPSVVPNTKLRYNRGPKSRSPRK